MLLITEHWQRGRAHGAQGRMAPSKRAAGNRRRSRAWLVAPLLAPLLLLLPGAESMATCYYETYERAAAVAPGSAPAAGKAGAGAAPQALPPGNYVRSDWPVATLTAPASGTSLAAPATISLQVSVANTLKDAVYRVEYYNGATLLATSTSSPWSATYTQSTSATLSITARAYTNCTSPTYEPAATANSAAATVTVTASSTPSAVLSVLGNSGLAPAAVSLSATVSSPGNVPISVVEFLANGSVVGRVSTPPYNYTWTNAGVGTWSMQARATNNQGGVGTSSASSVTVNAAPALPAEASLSLTRTSSFEYDPVSGLLVKEVVEPGNSDLCLVTQYRYDSWGNKDQVTTRNCNGSVAQNPGGTSEAGAPVGEAVFTARTASTVYDARGQFPLSSTNAAGQSESYTHDARFGVKTLLTGPNALQTSWAYDVWGRKTHEFRPDLTGTYWEYSGPCNSAGWTYYTNVAICYQVAQYEYTANWAGWSSYPVYTYLDQLERKLFSTRRNFDNTEWIDDGLVHLDSLGRVTRQHRSVQRNQWSTVTYTENSYDILGRVVSVSDSASGTVTQTALYDGLTLSATRYPGSGQAAQTTVTVKNAVGQTALSIDAESGRTRFAYDALANLRATETQGVLNTLEYDTRGRKTRMIDADMGTSWHYRYNAAGELVRQVDANNQTTTIGYDALGRMTWRSEPDLYSSWEYDSTGYQNSRCGRTDYKTVGKLVRAATSTGYERIQCYDDKGRSTAEITGYGSDSFRVDTAYNASTGRVDTVSYPAVASLPGGRLTIQNIYRSDTGHLQQVRNVATGAAIWTANALNASGQITSEGLGNGLSTSRVYDTRNRLVRVTTSGAVQDTTAGWNDVDTVTVRTWVNAGTTYSEYFSYDRMNRLQDAGTYANGTLLAGMQTRYDSQGNLTSKSGVGTYSYVPGTHRLASISGTVNGVANPGFSHDANGNVYAGAAFSVVWSSFNMPSTVTKTVAGTNVTDTFNYGPEHQRVRQIANLVNGSGQASGGTLSTLYVGGGLYERETNSATGLVEHKHYVAVAGRLVTVLIERSNATRQWNYFHQDHLGSTVAVTNDSGALVEAMSWDAWGKRRNLNGTPASGFMTAANDRGYTGHEQLDNIGLVHMNGRIYDPTLARFVSADPIVQAPDYTQSHNRYMYVVGNPMTLIDPSGYSWLSKTWKKLWNNQIVRTVIIAVASYYTAGWAAEAYEGYAAGTILEGGVATTIGGSVSFTSSVVAGAAGGATAGFLASNGDLKSAAQGALSGGLAGGLNSYFGSSYSAGRVAAESLGQAAVARAFGADWRAALKFQFAISSLTYANYAMRSEMIANSSQVTDNINGASNGFLGDGTKLAGARREWNEGWTPGSVDPQYLDCTSLMGGCQGAPKYSGDVRSSFFGRAYSPGSLPDVINESFSGPHDWFRNATGSYEANGMSRSFTGFRLRVDEFMNYAMIAPAAIFAVPGFITSVPGSASSLWIHKGRPR